LQDYLIEISEKNEEVGADGIGKKIRASVGEEQNANIKPSMPNDLSLFI